ncbi:MAG: hypothetical protein AVDCRST_MAG73-2158, partial [uncultured Thermomicrobiales bacterium]
GVRPRRDRRLPARRTTVPVCVTPPGGTGACHAPPQTRPLERLPDDRPRCPPSSQTRPRSRHHGGATIRPRRAARCDPGDHPLRLGTEQQPGRKGSGVRPGVRHGIRRRRGAGRLPAAPGARRGRAAGAGGGGGGAGVRPRTV